MPNRVKGPCNSLHSCEQKLKVYLDHNSKKHSEDFFVKMHVESLERNKGLKVFAYFKSTEVLKEFKTELA